MLFYPFHRTWPSPQQEHTQSDLSAALQTARPSQTSSAQRSPSPLVCRTNLHLLATWELPLGALNSRRAQPWPWWTAEETPSRWRLRTQSSATPTVTRSPQCSPTAPSSLCKLQPRTFMRCCNRRRALRRPSSTEWPRSAACTSTAPDIRTS